MSAPASTSAEGRTTADGAATTRRQARAARGSGAASAPTSPGPRTRVTSLDAVRGLMLVWSVTSDSLITPAPWYDHAAWGGVHPVDVVFPVFVTLSGCGLAFAYRRRIAVGPMLRRASVLLVVGLVYNLTLTLVTTGWTGWSTFRLTGVLQLYAVVVLVMALGHLITRTARGWLVITALLALGHAALIAGWAAGCDGGALTPACNPSGLMDPAVLGAGHVYAGAALGHDPEGLVAIAGAMVSAAAGATAGHALLGARDRWGNPAAAAPRMLALAAGLALAGTALAQVVMPMKRLWTSPFALLVAAAVVLALLVGHVVLDRPGVAEPSTGRQRALAGAAWPLIALGRNSLLVYFGSHALVVVLTRVPAPWAAPGADGSPAPSIAVAASQALSGGWHPQVVWSAVTLTAWWALACLLHRLRIYVRP